MAEPGSLGEVYARNRAGDLDYVPVEQPDTSTWLERVYGMIRQGITGDAQPGQRGTWVPSRINEQGQPELAVPGIIQQPAESLQSLMTAPLGDIVRSGDRDAMRAAAEASFDVSSMLPAAGVAAGRTIPEGAAGIFGGRLAKTADHAALKRAEAMEKDGFSRNDIRRDTGWFKDAGGNWRFEIDDSGASFGKGSTVGQALNHPALFDAYPQLKNTPVEPMQSGIATGKYVPRYKGALGGLFERFVGPSNKIGVSPDAKKPTMLHEVQHAVDDLEGSLANLNTANPYAGTTYNGAWFEDSARRVADRADMTPEQRAARAPWLDTKLPAPKAKETPQQITTRDDLPVLPERQALEDALASMGLNPNDRYMQALIDGLKGQLDTGAADRYNSLEQIAGMVNSDASRKFGKALSDYRAKAQQIGHNGGPATSTWDQPFVYSNPNDPTTAAVVALLSQQEKPKGITAYHGSPHDFDRFDMSKIGTGEGAQAYGHGLYFAENEGVARSYRDGLSGYRNHVIVDGRPVSAPEGIKKATPEQKAAIFARQAIEEGIPLSQKAFSIRMRARNAELDPKSLTEFQIEGGWGDHKSLSEAADILEQWTKRDVRPDKGRMYEVRINADPADFLDWDKPLSQQSEKVQQALKDARRYLIEDGTGTGGGWTPWKSAGASEKLRDAGIPGIRYLDQGSRTAGEGSRNYVVFDDKLVEILKKYSNPNDPTTAAILALLTAQQGGPPQQ